jgi:DNA polymerase elongation subunit (family B)
LKILLTDIETSPNLAYVWGLFKQNIPITNIKDSSTVMCYSAKWLGEKEIKFDSIYKSSPKKMLQGIHKLLCEADAVISYNGDNFDLPTLNKEFLLHGMPPPSPYRKIDLLKAARDQFRFVSNKLDYVAKALGLGQKTKHAGFQLWLDCLAKCPSAWKKMEEYNIQDTLLLEKVYYKMLPWIKNHPNRMLYDDIKGCPKCGSSSFQSRGLAHTQGSAYKRYQCNSCHGWFRGSKVEKRIKGEFKEIA